jgi:hypothetical protein
MQPGQNEEGRSRTVRHLAIGDADRKSSDTVFGWRGLDERLLAVDNMEPESSLYKSVLDYPDAKSGPLP